MLGVLFWKAGVCRDRISMHDPTRSLFLIFYETRGVHDNAAEPTTRRTSSSQGFSALRPELTPATRSAMSSVTTMTRDQQKDLIREVLREQPPAASRAASAQPPQPKKQRLDPFFDDLRIRTLSPRHQWDLEISGPCKHCYQPRIFNQNFAGCCGCPDCRCLTHRRIHDSTPSHLLHTIHDEVDRRRRWCAGVHGSDSQIHYIHVETARARSDDPTPYPAYSTKCMGTHPKFMEPHTFCMEQPIHAWCAQYCTVLYCSVEMSTYSVDTEAFFPGARARVLGKKSTNPAEFCMHY